MASTTYNHRKGSTFKAAMQRSAEKRRCPKCGRKSALISFSDEWQFGSYCRWDDCDYEAVTQRVE